MTFTLDALPQALETDKVMTVNQCARHFHASESDVRSLGIHTFDHDVGKTTNCTYQPTMHFVTLERRHARLSTADLRHLAGLAEMRLRLRASPHEWRVHLRRPDRGRMPDGQYTYKGECCALEFDAGSYKRERVLEKMEAYAREYDTQLWGAATSARVAYLRKCAAHAPQAVLVMHAPWFEKVFHS